MLDKVHRFSQANHPAMFSIHQSGARQPEEHDTVSCPCSGQQLLVTTRSSGRMTPNMLGLILAFVGGGSSRPAVCHRGDAVLHPRPSPCVRLRGGYRCGNLAKNASPCCPQAQERALDCRVAEPRWANCPPSNPSVPHTGHTQLSGPFPFLERHFHRAQPLPPVDL